MYIPYGRQSINEADIQAVVDVLKSDYVTTGPKILEFERKVADYVGAKYAVAIANGTAALHAACHVAGITKGDEVITTPVTFAASANCVLYCGAKPVFADIKETTYNIDPEDIKRKITSKTKAIIAVHYSGQPCEMDAIHNIADRHHLKVIYDAAHTFGEELDGEGVGSWGDASMFSFHATKVFHSIEGGAVAFKEKALERRLYQLKNFGIMDSETVEYVGANGKMNEFQAAMGLCNLRHVEEEIGKRRELAMRYRQRLEGIEGIRLCRENPRVKYNYAYMPVVFDGYNAERDEIFQALKEKNIYTRKYFYPCVNSYECYRGRFRAEDTPVADRISKQVLTLPLYADLPVEIVDLVCDTILEAGE